MTNSFLIIAKRPSKLSLWPYGRLLIQFTTCSSINELYFYFRKNKILLDLIVAEMDLVTHVQQGAFSQFEVVHCLGPFSCQDDHSEAVWERPKD